MDSAEIGLTKDLIYRITDFYNDWPVDDIEVFAFPAELEKVRGADIDLYIQDELTQEFRGYKIQAKLLKYPGVYKSLFYKGGTAQADNLMAYAKNSRAEALYIFYNGYYGNNCPTRDPYYGISLIQAATVKQQFVDGNINQSPRFEQLFDYMLPFHTLFCDIPRDGKISNAKKKSFSLPKPTIKREEILVDFPYFAVNKQSEEGQEQRVYNNQKDKRRARRIIKEYGLAPIRIVIKSNPKEEIIQQKLQY